MMVIANATLTGNCQRCQRYGRVESVGFKVIYGIRATLPACWPLIIVVSRSTIPWTRRRISLVPLQSLSDGQMFLNSMSGIWGFRQRRWGGSPAAVTEFKYSTNTCTASSTSIVESALVQVMASPGNSDDILLLIWSTDVFFGAKMACSEIHSKLWKLSFKWGNTQLMRVVMQAGMHNAAGMAMKSPDVLLIEPSPKRRSHSAKRRISSEPSCRTRMFSSNRWVTKLAHSGEVFSEALTICALLPCWTTGKICRKSPARTTTLFPKGSGVPVMSCRVLSSASNKYMWAIGASPQIVVRPWRMRIASSLWAAMLTVLSSVSIDCVYRNS